MTAVYLICFIAGFLPRLPVLVSRRERPREEHPRGERTFELSPPVVAGATAMFGVIGYLLTRRQVGTIVTRAIASAVVAGVAAVVTAYLVRKWWAVTPEHEVDDERYVLQGHLA